MTNTSRVLWRWTPRILGIAMALFLALFALDAFDGRPIVEVIPGFLIHLTPSFLVAAVVAIAWRYPLAGATACLALAIAYGLMVRWRFAWTVLIGGPLVVVGALFALSAFRTGATR